MSKESSGKPSGPRARENQFLQDRVQETFTGTRTELNMIAHRRRQIVRIARALKRSSVEAKK